MTYAVPHRIETERLTLRLYTPADTQALHDVLGANVEHLRPWMAWAHDEPKPLAQRVETIAFFAAEFEAGRDFTLGIFESSSGEYLGGTGLHVREGCPEIGYWIRADAQGRGFVTEASAALAAVSIELLGAPRVYLAADPANERSTAVARRLGMSVASEGDEPVGPGGAMRPTVLFALESVDFAGSPAADYARPHAVGADGTDLEWPG